MPGSSSTCRIWGLMGMRPPLPVVRVSRSVRLCRTGQHLHPSFTSRVRLVGSHYPLVCISHSVRLCCGDHHPHLLFDG